VRASRDSHQLLEQPEVMPAHINKKKQEKVGLIAPDLALKNFS
jgi:hypothetical protein